MASGRILVAEDDPALRRTIVELLVKWGYETEEASDGLEALEKLPAFDPSVVISDLRMPRLGGIELLKALRYGVPDVNCIIVSDHASRGQAAEATRLGAAAYVEKPLDPERLKVHLQNCLQNGPAM